MVIEFPKIEAKHRRKRPSGLMEKQQDKLVKDKEYEDAVAKLSGDFYSKKRSIVGVTSLEEAIYHAAKTLLWDTYEQWAIASGLYEEITLEEQELTAMADFTEELKALNVIRTRLSKKELHLTDKNLLS